MFLFSFCPGRALAVALAKRGVRISVLDLSPELAEETVRLVKEEHEKISYKPSTPSAIFIKCDVTKTGNFTWQFYYIPILFCYPL
jgi:NAD(P)-dependent dehydrogenase (short-subunit alcohol dehydrogenase family)